MPAENGMTFAPAFVGISPTPDLLGQPVHLETGQRHPQERAVTWFVAQRIDNDY
jgi:hypothetical protein